MVHVPRLRGCPVPAVFTIARKGGGFIAEVKARPDVKLIQVTRSNRETLADEIVHELQS